jgi:esterase/lipase superfamily enzyme
MRRCHRLFVLSSLTLPLILVGGVSSGVGAREVESSAGEDPPAVSTQTANRPKDASVFFATNRRRKKEEKPAVRFGGKRGERAFGTCEVEFKPIPMMDEVAEKVPFYVPAESSEQRIEVETEPEIFWGRLATAVETSGTGDVVVFVHGYSYDFERACDRAAEAQRVLGAEATVLMFTWPSNGRPTDYASDQKDMEWAVPFLQTVLQELSGRLGAENVQVLAHSLGSRGIVEAVVGLGAEGTREPLLGQLVLLAPDLDSGRFLEILPDLGLLIGDITLYASSNDTPLKFSRKVNGSPRLGQAGEFLTVAEGMETVDVTPAGRYQYLGHEYFYFHPLVVADLLELLTTRSGAADRSAPRPRWRNGLTYWEIVSEEKR